MASRRRWILGGLGVASLAGLAVLGTLGAALSRAFGSNLPLEDQARVGEAVTAVDGYVACYAVPAGDVGALVVDTCTDGTALDGALATLGLTAEDVSAVLLTHAHSDHAGGVAHFPNAWVFAHEDAVPFLSGEARFSGLITRWSKPYDPPIEVDRAVGDGQLVTVGEVACRAIHLPGHTPGSVAWLVGDVLFLGDSANGHEGGGVVPAVGFFSDDAAQNEASLAGLRARLEAGGWEVAHLAFGHSGPLPGGAL